MDISGYHLPSLAGAAATYVSVLKAFAWFDKDQSEDNRHFARDWLLGLNVNDRKWKQFFEELFTKFFGSKHLSWKSARRSFILSAGLIAGVFILRFVISHTDNDSDDDPEIWWQSFWWDVHNMLIWMVILVVCACAIDYLSLWKTRVLLTNMQSFRNGFMIIAIVIGDVFATTLLFFGVYLLIGTYAASIIAAAVECDQFFNAEWPLGGIPIPNSVISCFDYFRGETIPWMYWAALLTSAWLWIYLIVAYGMRVVSFLPLVLRRLSKILDFEEHPVRTLGYLAATVSAVLIWIATMI
jgi:hypothetical protein